MSKKPVSTHSETNTDGESRIRGRKTMLPSLAKIADRWSAEEKQLDGSELEIRYRWAKDVKTVYDSPDLYGSDAVELLFSLRMTCDHDPRVYASVANYIDDVFFSAVVSFNQTKASRKGHISWSHVIAFARMGDHAVRQHLLEQCMAEQWSVATLRAKVDEAFDEGVAESTTERRQAGVGTIAKRVARSAEKLAKDTMAIFGRDFRSSLDSVRDGDRVETLALVEAAQQAISDCRVQLITTEEALAAALQSLASKTGGTEPAKAKITKSVPPKPLAEDDASPAEPEATHKRRRVRRRVTPTVQSHELVTV